MCRDMRVVVNMSSTVQHEEHHLDQPGIHLFTRTTCGHCRKMKDTHMEAISSVAGRDLNARGKPSTMVRARKQ